MNVAKHLSKILRGSKGHTEAVKTFEYLSPSDRDMIQELWMRQHLAKNRSLGTGRRKNDAHPTTAVQS